MVAYLAPSFRINFPHVGGSVRSGWRGREPLGCESDVVSRWLAGGFEGNRGESLGQAIIDQHKET